MESIKSRSKLTGSGFPLSPAKLALVTILLVSFILSNYTNMTGSNWVFHPDDHEAYVLGKNLKEHGRLSIDDPLNRIFEYPVFIPSGATLAGGRVVPTRAFGIYFIAAAGFFLGDDGPFLLLPLCGLLALVFLFKTIELVMDEKKALLATFLVALSAPFLYWNNMLFANVPWLAMFMTGTYFLTKIGYKEKSRMIDYALSAIFFGLSIWMRYEAILLIVLLLSMVLARRGNFRLRGIALWLLVLVIILMPIALLNNSLYGSPLGVGYTAGRTTQASEDGERASSISTLYSRFFKNYLSPDVGKMQRNARSCLLTPMPILLVTGLLGLIVALVQHGRSRPFAVSMLFIGLIWSYYVLNGTLWAAGDSSSIASSYVRYMLMIYVILAIFSPLFIERLRPILGVGPYRAFLAIFIVAFLLSQMALLMLGPYGLKHTCELKADFKQVNAFVASTPSNSVVLASLYSKVIVSRPVFSPSVIKNPDRMSVTCDYLEELLKRGYEVYLVEASGHGSTFRNVSEFIIKNERALQLEPVTILPLQRASDKVERVVLVEQ